MRISIRWWFASLGVLSVSNCVRAPMTESPSFGRLEGVLKDVGQETRPAEPGETGLVEITRAGQQEQGRAEMELQKGDAIVTGAEGLGVLILADGYRVIMDPGTDITIENPSIFVRVGRIIVRKISEVREALTVRTDLGAAAVEGTEFVFEVSRSRAVQLTVLEGRVRFYPHGSGDTSQVGTMTLVGGQRGRLDRTTFSRLSPVTAGTADSLRRRIRYLEKTARPSRAVGADIRRDSIRTEPTRGVPRGVDLETCSIPDLTNLTEEQAVLALDEARMRVGQISRGSSRTVTGQVPVAGQARCGTAVSFTLGSVGAGTPR